MRVLIISLCLGFFWPCVALAEDNTFDTLLLQMKQTRQREADVRQQRKERFLATKEEQAKLLGQIKRRLAAEHKRSDNLKTAFDTNEKKLSDLETELKRRTGNLGEVFGAVRQTARDLSPLIRESLVSAQYPGRSDWLGELGESKKLPEIAKLEKLWLLVQGEIAESGRVIRMPAKVIDANGVAGQKNVVRVGLFNALEGERYLRYQPESGRFVVLARQPPGAVLSLAGEFTKAVDGFHELALDPTRGVLLGLLVEKPDLWERARQGGLVGYVIIALGIAGLLVVAVRLAFLWRMERRIRHQLGNLTTPSQDNPLGRILEVSAQIKSSDPINLELQIDEAVLREIPQLTRGEGIVKLLAGVAPLLGLLGTVVGMIITFQSITLFGTGDPKLMANGISQALVTTALGLIVAIPLLFLHSLLSSRSRILVQILDEQSAGLVAMGRELQ